MATKRLVHLLFANSYLPPFERSFFFQWLGPYLKPFILRVIQREYLQAWALLFLVWGLAMASLPSLHLLVSLFGKVLAALPILPHLLIESMTYSVNMALTSLGIWGMYYVARLHLTKLYYWRIDKYPSWPTDSILFQIDRYMFRPEVFAMLVVTFLWIQLTNFIQNNLFLHGVSLDWMTYVQLWVPWMGGAIWPTVSVFCHKQLLEL